MAKLQRQKVEEDCVNAFKSGNKLMAEQFLPHITPAVVRTTFQSLSNSRFVVSMVSLLHLAAYWGWEEMAVLLVSWHNCSADWRDKDGCIPLHYAAYNGHLEMVKYFIVRLLCNPMDKNKLMKTPLHIACINGNLNIVQYLIREVHCNPSCVDKLGDTPLHYACDNGHLNITQYLISEADCNPSCANRLGDTPLHYACDNGHLNIVQYLIGEIHCNPSCVDKVGSTPLHCACDNNHTHIVQYLLSTGHVNPLAENKHGRTPLSYATGKYDIIKLLQPYADCSRDYPVHTFTKLILTGDSGAGKTTIAQLIILLASKSCSAVPVDYVDDVQCFTAGIIPHHIKSELGNFVVYDFAGQQEYYSSHAAILEQVMRNSAATFLCVIDISKSNESICQSLHYWLTFINNACSAVEETSHVAIIGSHADQVASSNEIEEKSSLLKEVFSRRMHYQCNDLCVMMDCRRADTDASRNLISILNNSQNAINVRQPSISYYCHVLYAFLHTKLDMVGCSLHQLVSGITEASDSSLPSDLSVLTGLLTTLSDRGLILFIQHPRSSWVVVKTETLLNDINGTLFAPRHFKEHCDLASNTGIVPTSNLCKVFSQYNPDILLGFLVSLEFCRPVHPLVLQYTNLQTTLSHSTADLLFFPGLIQSEQPHSLTQHLTLQFGWCLGCMDPHEFFSSRFLHVLLLLVAYRYPLANPSHPHSFISGLQRMCTIWRNGICWRDYDNVTTVIEFLDNNRWVLVAMSCDHTSPIQHAELRSSLIALVLHLQQEHCPHLNVSEFLVSPHLVSHYPIESLPGSDLFHVHHVARSILLHKSGVPSHKDVRGFLLLQSLPFEPYHLLSPSLVCQLHNPNMADQTVPVTLLYEAQEVCRHSKIKAHVFKELRDQMDKLSIFAGRNPLEVAELKEEELPSDTSSPTVGASILSIADLFEVKKFLNNVINWKDLGLALGLLYIPTLKKIEMEHRGSIDDCKTEMLAAWLQQQDDVCTPSWSSLRAALRSIKKMS